MNLTNARNWRPSLTQAEACLTQNNIADAIAICHQIIKITPNESKAYTVLGNILRSQGKRSQATRCYQIAISLDPELAEVHVNLGSLAGEQGEFERAIAHYQIAIQLNPNLTSNVVKRLEQQGRVEEAIAIQTHWATLQKPPLAEDDWIACFNQGNTHAAEKNLEQAVRSYQKSLELNPNHADTYLNLGIVFRQQGQLHEAIARYHQAIAIAPNLADAYLSLGNVYFQLNHDELALSSWQKALNLQPNIGDAEVRVNLGNVLVHLNQIERAIAQYQQALELDPNCLNAYYNLANLLSEQGKTEEAIAAYQNAIAIDPQFIDAYLYLGELFETLERYDEAIATYINILKLEFHDSMAFYKLAHVSAKKGLVNESHIFYARDIPISLFKQYSQVARTWGFTTKMALNSICRVGKSLPTLSGGSVHKCCTYIDLHPPSFHQLSAPQTTDPQLHDRFKQTQFACPPTSVTVVPEGTIRAADYFNKLVFNSNNQLLEDSCSGNLFWLSDERNFPALEYLDETVAYISVKPLPNYYHWLSDLLPRLELIRKSGISFNQIDRFMIDHTGLPIQRETLTLLGIPAEKIDSRDRPIHLKAKTSIVPSLTGSIWYMSKWVCDFLRQQFLPIAKQSKNNQPEPKFKRIYICRESKYRRILNEAEVISVLKSKGFEMVRLQSLSFVEQVKLFANAKIVISSHGSGLANIVFCQPQTKILELFPSSYIVRFYWKLSNLVNLDYYYLISHPGDGSDLVSNHVSNSPSESDPAYQDFTINLKTLEQLMQLANI